ncbi:hypothetical protein YC2023_025660 [Brassica napus]
MKSVYKMTKPFGIQAVAVAYFRSAYAPTNHPLESSIFPKVSNVFLLREDVYHIHRSSYNRTENLWRLPQVQSRKKKRSRNKERVIINEKSGYLMRTEVCSSNEVSASSFINLNALLLQVISKACAGRAHLVYGP